MQPMNAVTIRNAGVGPIVDEYAEAFAGRAIYSMGDLYSRYDQFQIAEGSSDLTTIKTPLGLVRMCMLPQGQDDAEGNRFAARFGARVLSNTQRDYPQVKRELWGTVTAMKALKEYLMGAVVVVETDCLPLLGMITNCSTPNVTMLNWIAYIKSLNSEFKHIAGKENVVADMLSRARYDGEDEMIEDDDDLGMEFCSISHLREDGFREELYEGDLLEIGWYLHTLKKRDSWSDEQYRGIRKKSYNYMLKDGYLWKRPKRRDGLPLRVVCDVETQQKLMKEFHESLWAGHRGIWATFAKVKERFLLEDVISRYGCVGRITADRGELDTHEAKEFFQRYGVKLSLTTAYNLEGNAKSERGYMPAELMQGQKPIMPTEEQVPTWSVLPWKDGMTREELLELRIRQLEQRAEDVGIALEKLKHARLRNKDRFDKRHRLRPKPIREGDWVLVYDNSLDNQHSALRKFSKRWFGSYVVVEVNNNVTYTLRELDGARLRTPIAGKRVKIFKRRDGSADFAEEVEDEDLLEAEHDCEGDEGMSSL
ncbi:hypothetical protein R1sor_003707 [Riccia sorocarpa]|uniref:Reverse transcriptase RNase H-like domain-containing protein n=1 Tax=Riccia sorocarpa TaxID=122646 RepID=A0ABD3H5U6_9MARC